MSKNMRMATEHFDAIVIGSGFGGSVMTYRLTEAGLRVCLLERGKKYPPGSFPRSPADVRGIFWDPSEGLHGLFNVWSFKSFEAIVSSGLGGGSLVYSNVAVRKDEKWFVREDGEYWTLSRAELDPHYDRVEKMLNVQPYPFAHAPYSQTPKTVAFTQAAQQLGMDWFLPNLAVTFANEGELPTPGEPIKEMRPNLHRRTRVTCRLCGECNVGCNYGSKNTLDYNYLSEAERLGADIRARCEARSLEPREGGGYVVRYVEHAAESEGRKTATRSLSEITLTCDRLILSAGALGTPFLLLKNKTRFPKLSKALGTRFSGNGDLLGFAMNSRAFVRQREIARRVDPAYGPGITAAVRVPDIVDGGQGRGHYVEEAGYPDLLNWVIELGNVPAVLSRVARVLAGRLKMNLRGRSDSNLSAELSSVIGQSLASSTSVPLLGMGRDIPNGQMSLRRDLLEINWDSSRSNEFFEGLQDTMRKISDAMGATFKPNPTWLLSKRVVTVHPLGGCPMGRNENEAVVDSNGEVFNYPGLFIADGSIMPGSIGPNPSLTIAAMSDHIADAILASNN